MANKSRTNRNRQFGIGLVLALLVTGIILLPGASTTSAQSAGGGFSGAILELIPDDSLPRTTTTLSTITAGARGTSFYIQGIVYRNRSTNTDCTRNTIRPDVFVSEDEEGARVGVWRMWGVRTGEKTPVNNPTVPTDLIGQPVGAGSISGGNIAVVNLSVELEGYNGTLQFQGTLGRDFGAIESAGHGASDILAITGGTGTFRSASGDGVISPLLLNGFTNISTPPPPPPPPFPFVPTLCPSTTFGAGGFQLFLKEGNRFPPRFGNLIP